MISKSINPEAAGCVIVAADFSTVEEVLALAKKLKGTGAVIKVNSILREAGYGLITELKSFGLKVFADLKLNDIGNTMANDARALAKYQPDIVTVMVSAGESAISEVQKILPKTIVAGVTVLTSLNEQECFGIFGDSVLDKVKKFAAMVYSAELKGLVCSPRELQGLKFAGDLITPGVRPSFVEVKGDDQSRKATPEEAMKAGATYIVVGRPITQADDPLEALAKICEEIEPFAMKAYS